MLLAFAFLGSSCIKNSNQAEATSDSLSLKYTVLTTLPHNTDAFTEGLVMHDNKLLESTGLNNQSWIAEVNMESGEHNKRVFLDRRYFGEGITVLNQKIYQLTYQEKVGFVYDAVSYNKVGEFEYKTEGWGITHDHRNLIMSDGSYRLYFLDTANYQVVRTLEVRDPAGTKIKNLNELEYVDGYIFANVHETSQIVKIDPENGKIVGKLDFSFLTTEAKRTYQNASELNGIAYNRSNNTLLITGKFWPRAYLVRIEQFGSPQH
jgi:glutaminyl-peptide cyclotransferase